MNGADDEAATAVQTTLVSHQWRGLTAEALARLFLAARDRHRVDQLLDQCDVAETGTWQPLLPVEADDVRVAPLVTHLRGTRWSQMSLPAVIEQLDSALDRWWFRWQWRRGCDDAQAPDDQA